MSMLLVSLPAWGLALGAIGYFSICLVRDVRLRRRTLANLWTVSSEANKLIDKQDRLSRLDLEFRARRFDGASLISEDELSHVIRTFPQWSWDAFPVFLERPNEGLVLTSEYSLEVSHASPADVRHLSGSDLVIASVDEDTIEKMKALRNMLNFYLDDVRAGAEIVDSEEFYGVLRQVGIEEVQDAAESNPALTELALKAGLPIP